MDPKSAGEECFAAQLWEELAAQNNLSLALARALYDVFPDIISAVISADRGVRHETDLGPGSKYCVIR